MRAASRQAPRDSRRGKLSVLPIPPFVEMGPQPPWTWDVRAGSALLSIRLVVSDPKWGPPRNEFAIPSTLIVP